MKFGFTWVDIGGGIEYSKWPKDGSCMSMFRVSSAKWKLRSPGKCRRRNVARAWWLIRFRGLSQVSIPDLVRPSHWLRYATFHPTNIYTYAFSTHPQVYLHPPEFISSSPPSEIEDRQAIVVEFPRLVDKVYLNPSLSTHLLSFAR